MKIQEIAKAIDDAWEVLETFPGSIRKDPDGYRVTIQIREYECRTFIEKKLSTALIRAVLTLEN